jgi:hypothetical protein
MAMTKTIIITCAVPRTRSTIRLRRSSHSCIDMLILLTDIYYAL